MTPTRAGVYRVRTTGADTTGSFQVALGESIAAKIVMVVALGLVIGGVLGIAGVILLIVTRRSRRHVGAPQSWSPPPAS